MNTIATPASQPVVPPIDGPMQYLPVSLFGSVMGLTGLSVAWRLAYGHFGTSMAIAQGIGLIAVIDFVVLVMAYGTKLIFAPQAVRAEFAHPVASNMFGTFIISVLLLPLVIAPVSLPLARGTWIFGVVAMLAFAWVIVDRWINEVPQRHEHAMPAWIVPVVGLLDVPLALPSLDLPGLHAVMVAGLAVGLFFGAVLFTLIMARLMFEPPMAPALQPSLLILLAPTGVGLSTYTATTGQVDLFAECLYLVTLFLLAVLVGRLRHVVRACPFRVGWWAVSFPLSACAIAGLKVAMAFRTPIADDAAIALLALATIAIVVVAWRTLQGIARGELRALST